MQKLSILLILVFGILTARAGDPIGLWPGGMLADKGNFGTEQDVTKPSDDLYGGKRVTRISNVSVPTITLYRPAAEKDTGAAVLVCPGGGYQLLSMDLEGTEVCQWLNSIGVTAILLKYRVPAREGAERYTAPLQDVQRALGLVRYHANEWHIDPKRIGIIGFSAGGHLSAAASTRFETRTYKALDDADQVSCRPDFAMLIYPAYLVREVGPALGPELEPELTVSSNTSPTFLVQTEDDPIHVENALFYYLALKKANVSAELHIFAKGGHAYALRKSDKAVMTWPNRAEEWLNGLGVLQAKTNVLADNHISKLNRKITW
jgi:acetyl esterase/lipase